MLVAPAAHHRGLNKYGPRIDVVVRAREYTRYNSNPGYRGPLSPLKSIAVNNLRKMTRTADGLVYHLTGVEDVRIDWLGHVDSVYVNGYRHTFGGSFMDLLNLIDNRTLTAWDHKQ